MNRLILSSWDGVLDGGGRELKGPNGFCDCGGGGGEL